MTTPSNNKQGDEDSHEFRIPKPIKVDLAESFSVPNEVSAEYEITTFGSYRREKDKEYLKNWHDKHRKADVIVVNQDGQVLYALYKSPLGHHNDMVDSLFKSLRAQRYIEFDEEIL